VRYAVVSDVHSNLEALTATLREARRIGYDRLISLGDLVGYNADPSACLERLAGEIEFGVLGNHDAAAVDPGVANYFNPSAQKAAIWTSKRLNKAEKDFLSSFPLILSPEPDLLLVHGAPSGPEAWSYVISPADAHFEFERFEERVCLFGHSHLAMGFVRERAGTVRVFRGNELVLGKGRRYMINPGSVGQPRDGDPRAAFGILDTDHCAFEFHRVEYDIASAQDKVRRAGLPPDLARRLAQGI
jgi:predicted phosphodiesterase